MKKWEPDQVIAVVIVVGCLVLIALGINSEVKAILSMAAAWLFGRKYSQIKSKGANTNGQDTGADSS